MADQDRIGYPSSLQPVEIVMSFNADEIRELIVRPVLQYLGMYSPAAEELMMGTMAHESLMGKYSRQIKGPAQGFFQVEPLTEQDNWDNYLKYRPELADKVKTLMRLAPESADALVTNPLYCCAHARIKYFRAAPPLPAADDIQGLAQYWKDHFNSVLGKGDPDDWIAHYRKYVKGE